MKILTRGLTGSAHSVMLQGHGYAVSILRAGRSAASRALKDLTETFKISAMLISHNSSDIFKPIAQNIRKTFGQNDIVIRRAMPKSMNIENQKI